MPDNVLTNGSVTVGSDVTGAIDFSGDSDWHSIILVADQAYVVDMKGVSTNDGTLQYPYINLRDSTGNVVKSAYGGGTGNNTQLTITPTSGGRYFIDARSAGIEINKTYRLTVSGPTRNNAVKLGTVFSSRSSTQSYIRISNTSARSGAAIFTIRDAADGRVVGTWNSPQIAPTTSRQFPINQIEGEAKVPNPLPGSYAITAQPLFGSGYLQSIYWRPADGTLTNSTTCDAGVGTSPTALNNVHSSILDNGYPSTVVVNNTSTTSASATLAISDSFNGNKLNTYVTGLIPAGGQLRIPIAAIEREAKINPGTSIYHYNVNIQGSFQGFLQHLVTNNQVGVITDMTTQCSFEVANSRPSATPRVPTVFSTAQTGTQSFIRLHNIGASAGTARLSLLSETNGVVLAQWTSPSIAAGASKQFSIDEIEKGTGATFSKPGGYTISIQPNMSGYIQHVLYRPADGTLTNSSTCDAGVTANATQLINVHSSILDFGYPSTVAVANTGATATAVTLGIYDSTSGVRLGTYPTASIPAFSQLNLPVTTIEAGARISPGSGIYHYNIKAENTFTGFLQHLVTNKQAGVITDMTTVCQLPPQQLSIQKVTSDPTTSSYAGVIYPTRFSIKVADELGNPMRQQPVSWSADNGGWAIEADTMTDSSGIASAYWAFGLHSTPKLTATIETPTGSKAAVFLGRTKAWASNPNYISVNYSDNFPSASGVSRDVTPLTDPVGTYYAAIVFDGGYAGIQQTTSGKKLLFSVWDRNGKQSSVINSGTAACGNFGGEGTGKQCFMDYQWQIGKTYRFEVTSTLNPDSTDFTAYFVDVETGARIFIATLRQDGRTLHTSAGAFVEDYIMASRDCMSIAEKRAIFSNTKYLANGIWANQSMSRAFLPHDPLQHCATQGYVVRGNGIEMGVGGSWRAATVKTNIALPY